MVSISYKYCIITCLIILLSVASSYAQLNTNKTTGSDFLNNSKPEINVSLSSSFSTLGNGYTVFGTTLMPQMSFPVSDKFSVSTGIGYTTLFTGGGNMFGTTGSYGHLFVSGDYLVNEKITLRGTAYKTFSLGASSGINDEKKGQLINDFSSQGFIMDVEYKVTDNFRVNVGVEYRKQNYPLFHPGMIPPGQFMGIGNPSDSFFNNNLNPSW